MMLKFGLWVQYAPREYSRERPASSGNAALISTFLAIIFHAQTHTSGAFLQIHRPAAANSAVVLRTEISLISPGTLLH